MLRFHHCDNVAQRKRTKREGRYPYHVSVPMTKEMNRGINDTAERQGVRVTELIRRVLAVYLGGASVRQSDQESLFDPQ